MIKNTNNKTEIYLKTTQAAELLNVSVSTLKKWISTNRIKTVKTPGGHYRIRKSDLLEMGE